MNEFVVSLVRTYVPLLVGIVATWVGAQLGISVPDEHVATVSGLAVAGVAAIYYAGVRFLERRWPWFSKLLGSKQQPTTYAVPEKPPAQ
ncbi:MAG TPA: hypothetical protein VFQ40_08490 [Actinomycetota bacterium]|nr:hypothetical protein [Actinomycetota bacterium]